MVGETEQGVIKALSRAEIGTFKDSLRSPIHRWFTYPAGFSYKAVEEAIKEYGLKRGQTIYDPFVGTGTTQIVAKQRGINSVGIEAHPFVYEVARIKLFWEFDYQRLDLQISQLEKWLSEGSGACPPLDKDTERLPALLKNCFDERKLKLLYQLKASIEDFAGSDVHFGDLGWLALVSILRQVADVETGWPYIAPKKPLKSNSNKDVVKAFLRQIRLMRDDLSSVNQSIMPSTTRTVLGDARISTPGLDNESVDFAFTSPPYLNNYDYADRTRLETYFFGICSSWQDITERIRSKLITSATTQVHRNGWRLDTAFIDELKRVPTIYDELFRKVRQLSEIRLQKGGKKSYDLMVSGYFNDMYKAMRQTADVLRQGATFIMILGDSAPYGVLIPTERYLGEIGLSVGFTDYRIEELRGRGGKWRTNPQRHKVALRESLLILKK